MASTEHSAQQAINCSASSSISSSPAKTSEMQTFAWVVYEIFLYLIMTETHDCLSKKSVFSKVTYPCVELDKMWEMVQKLFERKGKQIKIKYLCRYHDLKCHSLGNKAMIFY